MNRPELRKPPPLTLEGEPVKPVPEQSFFQKYWMYGLIAMAALRKSRPIELDVKSLK
jgi:hypothetical protein